MENINGVSFEEYASASGNMAQGMPEEQVMDILGLEPEVWKETLDQWNTKLGELMTTNMDYAMKYGELFANPKAGRFATATSPALSLEEILPLAPDYDSYQKIFWHQSVAAERGHDPVKILKTYGLDLGKWGTLNMHYLNHQNNLLDHTAPDYAEKFEYFRQLQDKWRSHFEAQYN